MSYNPINELYESVIKLKQGFYNYKYVEVDSNSEIIHGKIDGNFDETENEYNVIVYYRNYGRDMIELWVLEKGYHNTLRTKKIHYF